MTQTQSAKPWLILRTLSSLCDDCICTLPASAHPKNSKQIQAICKQHQLRRAAASCLTQPNALLSSPSTSQAHMSHIGSPTQVKVTWLTKSLQHKSSSHGSHRALQCKSSSHESHRAPQAQVKLTWLTQSTVLSKHKHKPGISGLALQPSKP